MNVECYTSFEDARPLQAQWDALVEEVGGDVYSTFDWCAVWWRHYGKGRVLRLCVARDGDDVVAVVPLFSETLWYGLVPVRVVRVVGCDHTVTSCGFAVRPGHAREVCAALIDQLCGVEPWDLLHLGPLAGYFEHAQALHEGFSSCRAVGLVELDGRRHGMQTLIDLPGDYDAYMKSLPRDERRSMTKRLRQLSEEHAYQSRVVRDEGEVGAAFQELLRLHQTQWTARRRLGHFGDWPHAVGFHGDMVLAQSRHGRTRLVEIRAGSEPLGVQYAYRFGGRMHWILMGRSVDPQWQSYGPGKLLHLATVREAIEGGCRQIDDMKGHYEYKLKLGGRMVPFIAICVFRRGFGHRARVRMLRAAAGILDLAYYRVWFSRVADRVPHQRRQLWEAWIRSRL